MIKKNYNKLKTLSIFIAVLTIITNVAVYRVFATESTNENFGGMMGNWDWSDMMGFGFGGGILSGIAMIVFWVIVVLAGLAFLRWIMEYPGGNTGTSDKAMEILKEKYAKGEITKEEFEAKKKDLI